MSQQVLYGFPCVQNPHNFVPDPEASTEVERAAHAEACRTWGTKAFVPNVGCATLVDSPEAYVHIARTSWGLGTNIHVECDGGCDGWLDDEPLIACHDCGRDYCRPCWAKHDALGDCRRRTSHE